MADVLLFILLFFVIAAVLRIRFFFYVLYVLFGIYILARFWSRKAARNLNYRREMEERAFLGERVPVRLEVANKGWLPVPWVRVSEELPIALASPNTFRQVITLGPKAQETLSYTLVGNRRGYYPVGPLSLDTGDVWGLETLEVRASEVNHLTVYPKIVPIEKLGLPSKSPFGTLRSKERIYEDPSRVMGVRDYTPGDSLRRINWKTSAALGKLQVKRLEPAISLETALFLNLNREEYERQRADDATELGIVAAASIATYIIGLRQAVGLSTNGLDPFRGETKTVSLPPRKERAHLMSILDVLARIEATSTFPFTQLLQWESLGLAWGVTLIAITPAETEELFHTLSQLRRRGFHIVLCLTDPSGPFSRTKSRAESLGFQAHAIREERDLRVMG